MREIKITHKELVRRAGIWLRNNQKSSVVLTELVTQAGEIPDAIGFYSCGGNSILVECKATRSDFLSDKHKLFRIYSEIGMGDQRYFLAPRGLLKPEELPPDWGLLEATEYRIMQKKEASFVKADKNKEITMLVSVLRRLEISTAVFVRQDIT